MSIKAGFHEFYHDLIGDRWETLQKALLKERDPIPFSNGVEKTYYLDEGSIRAAEALEVHPGDQVLDLCAAPGGKTLVIATKLGNMGSLVSNDRSAARRRRLRIVLDEYLPREVREQVSVTSHDATKWCLYETDAYDRILLDAPCSSERHTLSSPRYLKQWSPSRTKRLALQQYAMLASALDVVRTGGIILYSTCAISPLENDEVIRRLLKKRPGRVEILMVEAPMGEKTDFGWQIWPDITGGLGPIYFSKIKRIE